MLNLNELGMMRADDSGMRAGQKQEETQQTADGGLKRDKACERDEKCRFKRNGTVRTSTAIECAYVHRVSSGGSVSIEMATAFGAAWRANKPYGGWSAGDFFRRIVP